LAGLWITRRLDRGYVAALERSLRNRAVELKLEEVADHTTRATLVRTMAGFEAYPRPRVEHRAELPPTPPNPLLHRIAELRTGDAFRVRRALADGVLTAPVVPHAIALLGWDQVAADAARALQAAGPDITGQLIDALLADSTEFAIRRRIPRILAAFPSVRARDALLLAMNDKRFEVRYRCGRALRSMLERDPGLGFAPTDIYLAVSRELDVDQHLWQSHRLLDSSEADELLGDRAHRGLEHVFTLLSLVLPKEPLRISFNGLHTDDAMLRGTALEYLDSVLPPPVRDRLRVLLDETRQGSHPPHDQSEVLAALLQSHESIQAKLAELRARRDAAKASD